MNVDIVNQNFTDLAKIVYQGMTLYKCGTSSLSDVDFLETDFKYYQNKIKFYSPSVFSYLEDSDKVLVRSSLEKYRMTLFPTYKVEESSNIEDSYYTTYIDKNGDELLVVLIPEGIDGVMLYEKISDASSNPAINITFESSESGFSKILYILTSYNSESPRILNISYITYRGDQEGNKSMSDYVLRNDALEDTVRRGYREKGGYMFSCISGSVIGTEKLEERPLYDLIKSFNTDDWNRKRMYSIGDIVVVGSQRYESTEPHNLGNHPYYSRFWKKILS